MGFLFFVDKKKKKIARYKLRILKKKSALWDNLRTENINSKLWDTRSHKSQLPKKNLNCDTEIHNCDINCAILLKRQNLDFF